MNTRAPRPATVRSGLVGPFLLSLTGAALLSWVGFRYRIDVLRCASWPPMGQNIVAAAVFLLSVAFLALGWLSVLRRCQRAAGPSTRQILLAGAVLYGVAALAPPALSDDPLFYAAIGRVQAEYQASPRQPLCQTLPADDALLQHLIPHWRCGRSPYLPGFDLAARGLAVLSQGSLQGLLRGFQVLAGAALLGAGALLALAVRGSSLSPAYAAALVVFNPLAVIEGPASAHNDALLALSCAAFVWSFQRRNRLGMLGSQSLGLLVKSSSLLLLGIWQGALALHRLAALRHDLWHSPRVRAALRVVVGLALLFIGWALYQIRPEVLFGPSHLPWEHCTRSIECLPRTLLRTVLQRPTAALAMAVAFRLLSITWLLYVAWRASQERPRLLCWLGTGLLIYYLYLHPWSQSWYLLSLLPLSPWLGPRASRALHAVSISASAYYALVLIGNCFTHDLWVAGFDLAEALIVLIPPTVCLLRPCAQDVA